MKHTLPKKLINVYKELFFNRQSLIYVYLSIRKYM